MTYSTPILFGISHSENEAMGNRYQYSQMCCMTTK